MTLEPLENSPASNSMMAQVPINNSTTYFYTVEVRHKIGYDVKLPGEAVIIHEVNTNRPNTAQVIDIDGNGNTGEAGAQWQAGEVFTDTANNIKISIISTTGSGGYVVTIANGDQTPTCPAVINGWKGEYWGNRDLSGTRVLCRDDFDLDFN